MSYACFIDTLIVYLGANSGRFIETGYNNTYIGTFSGETDSVVEGNVYIGTNSGRKNKTGNDNTSIGFYSGLDSKGSNNVFIGSSSGFNAEGSDKLYIENSSSNIPLTGGDFVADRVGIN